MKRILKGIGSFEKGEAVMVGDRKFDIIGAHELGLPGIYAAYGYGNPAERKESGPDYIAETVEDLVALLLSD